MREWQLESAHPAPAAAAGADGNQWPGAIFVAHAAFFENSSADSQFPPPSVGPSVRPSVRLTNNDDSRRRRFFLPFSPVECVRVRACLRARECPVHRPSTGQHRRCSRRTGRGGAARRWRHRWARWSHEITGRASGRGEPSTTDGRTNERTNPDSLIWRGRGAESRKANRIECTQ